VRRTRVSVSKLAYFRTALFGIPFETPVTEETSWHGPGVLSQRAQAEAFVALGWQVPRVIVALAATAAGHIQIALIGARAEI
jgi:hypothetical protein